MLSFLLPSDVLILWFEIDILRSVRSKYCIIPRVLVFQFRIYFIYLFNLYTTEYDFLCHTAIMQHFSELLVWTATKESSRQKPFKI